ncbi:MAG: TIGR00730 family Rossman fold protein [Proteobacteria bacterium]|nr:TIGR00730 family Rossman fold protein [Pseudomonadota bacterium]MCH9749873.1 TIGR00730 family Rossman fold protein [Pseudomonadota bacterium]
MNIEVVESELKHAATVLDQFTHNISIFGSARITDESDLAKTAYQLCKELSNQGFNILTGAGPGIMKAANKGAFEGKSSSIGLNIKLPKEQNSNPYLDQCLMFEHFFTRKVTLIKYADACVFFPGGLGTVDELMEVLTLVQTRKGRKIKIFLLSEVFWRPLINWLKTLEQYQYIAKSDLELFCIVDDIEDIITQIKE